MRRRRLLLGVVFLAAAAAGCGGTSTTDWVADDVYLVDDRSSCVTATDRADGRRVLVCRDNRGTVTCHLDVDPHQPTSGPDCDAAIEAVRDRETETAISVDGNA